jgi:hypothetical protein
MVAVWRIAILVVSLLIAITSAASAAEFVSQPYDGQVFTSGIGPFTWRFESSHETGEYSGVAYRLSTDGVWHRCRDTEVTQSGRRIPPSVSLSNLAEGTYSIEITDDQSKYWLIKEGIAQSGIDTCGRQEYPGYGAVSTDSFTIRAPTVERPPELVPATPAEPGTSPSQGSVSTSPTPSVAPAPAPTQLSTPTRQCRPGYTRALIGGHATCLHAGAHCVWRRQREYPRYHFACVRKGRQFELERLTIKRHPG